jgi:hypothetical protein
VAAALHLLQQPGHDLFKKLGMKQQNKNRCVRVLACAMLLVACGERTTIKQNTPDTALATPAADTGALRTVLVPGERLGHITLGLNADSVEPLLGMPDASDAAMGKAWLTWKGKENTAGPSLLQLYTTYKDTSMSVKTVKQIRTTSPYFKTVTGLHVGSTLAQLKAVFPALKKTDDYTEAGVQYELYDAVAAGIAFEMKAGVCTGILVHEKGQRADSIYIMLHPDMKRL